MEGCKVSRKCKEVHLTKSPLLNIFNRSHSGEMLHLLPSSCSDIFMVIYYMSFLPACLSYSYNLSVQDFLLSPPLLSVSLPAASLLHPLHW